MNEHVTKTIEMVRERIRTLEGLVVSLVELNGGPANPAPAPREMVREKTAARRAPVVALAKGGDKRKPTLVTPGGPDGLGKRIQAAIEAHQPSDNFSLVEVHAWLRDKSIEVKQVGWMLAYEAQMGRLKIAVRGKPGNPTLYEAIGPKAVKAEVPAGPVTRAAVGRTKALVENELAGALKERDTHRREGRTTMELIAQRKIDRLGEELEQLP